ncbi:hypothetical protein [Flavobacterium cerinum]|uniref:Uncharacterized protein n=1 Tax=Flavobacterium cerinum TaxID=2502784 RepID=A0A3S3RDC4_9FLAO|nr:hypothetical protein [Flavobacterium cerinum]RWW92054.1 hypothetical protein EPI11_16750 [Flavobacterium cerinum]
MIEKWIIMLVLFCFATGYAQNDKDVYLLFKEGARSICRHSMFKDGREKTEIDFICKKRNSEGKVWFIMCLRNFEAIDNGETITVEEFQKLKIGTIDDLMRKAESDWQVTHKGNIFKDIYIIEENEGKYNKFKVKWIGVYEDE